MLRTSNGYIWKGQTSAPYCSTNGQGGDDATKSTVKLSRTAPPAVDRNTEDSSPAEIHNIINNQPIWSAKNVILDNRQKHLDLRQAHSDRQLFERAKSEFIHIPSAMEQTATPEIVKYNSNLIPIQQPLDQQIQTLSLKGDAQKFPPKRTFIQSETNSIPRTGVLPTPITAGPTEPPKKFCIPKYAYRDRRVPLNGTRPTLIPDVDVQRSSYPSNAPITGLDAHRPGDYDAVLDRTIQEAKTLTREQYLIDDLKEQAHFHSVEEDEHQISMEITTDNDDNDKLSDEKNIKIQIHSSKPPPAHNAIIFRDGRYSANTVINDLEWLNIRVGHKRNRGPIVKAIVDTGCTHTCMSQELWNEVPAHNVLNYEEVDQIVGTAGQNYFLEIKIKAWLYMSMQSVDGRECYLRQEVFVIAGMSHEFFIGIDITSGRRMISFHHDCLIFSKHKHRQPIHITYPHEDVFIVRKWTNKSVQDGTITINANIILPPHLSTCITAIIPDNANTIEELRGLTLTNPNYGAYNIDSCTVDKQYINTIHIIVTNFHDHPHTLHEGDVLANCKFGRGVPVAQMCAVTQIHGNPPEPKEKRNIIPPEDKLKEITANEIEVIADTLKDDPYMDAEEIEVELNKYKNTGRCSQSASHLIDMKSQLQILEIPKPKPDLTPDELVASVRIDHLSEPQQKQVREMLHRVVDIFAKNELDVERTPVLEARIQVIPGHELQHQKYIPVPNAMKDQAMEIIRYFEEAGIVAYCRQTWSIHQRHQLHQEEGNEYS